MNLGQNGMELLANRTWRDLRATARMHNFHFDNRWTHAEALAALHHFLLGQNQLAKVIRQLADDERAALMALKAHDGRIMRYIFTQRFGQIRRYRPWRDDAPPHPWRRPISIAEKLWFLGLIEVQDHQAVLLPETVAALLPDVPHPQTAVWAGDAPDLDPAGIVRDVAALLGTLLHTPIRPWHGRWLPPYALKAINARLSIPENLDGVRSEFAAGRVRFLHYLALVAGLVSVQDRVLLPTAEAWGWLRLPYNKAHARLMAAIRADLHTRQPLWETFRLPPVGERVWDALADLPPGDYTVGSVAAAINLHTLDPFAVTHMRAALLGPLRWLGVGAVDLGQMTRRAPVFAETGHAVLHICRDSLGITLPSVPSLPPLVELLSWAAVDDAGLRLDTACIARAVESGMTIPHLIRTLVDLTGAPLPDSARHKLEDWGRAAHQVRIRHAAVLEVAQPEDMTAIRKDWRLRPFLGEQLSPRHIVVRDEYKLRLRLIRRGYRVPPLPDRRADPIPRVNDSDPAYLWLALRVCQELSGLIPAPVMFPGAAARALEAQLGDRLETLGGMVDAYVGRIQGTLRYPGDVPEERPQHDPVGIRQAVEGAHEAASAVHIRYYSPYADEETERTIEPQTIYERDGATYVEAWCHLDSAPRTFRLDRILAVGSG
ncbi:MAG: WYL domain-containing protein [Anaerolineaceae bacterium]|nr:WYL domain-containing protein [Anaerolineaceae bacterium]